MREVIKTIAQLVGIVAGALTATMATKTLLDSKPSEPEAKSLGDGLRERLRQRKRLFDRFRAR